MDQTRINERAPELLPELRHRERRNQFGEITGDGELNLRDAGLSCMPEFMLN